MSAVLHITNENFENEVLKSDKPVLVDFFAQWCGPCKMTAPVIEELAGEMSEVKFAKIDVDECPEIATKYGIMSIPSMYVFKNGDVASRQIGALGKQELSSFINKSI